MSNGSKTSYRTTPATTETEAVRYLIKFPENLSRVLWILAGLTAALVFSCGMAVSSMYYTTRHLERVERDVDDWQKKVDEQNAILIREGLKDPDLVKYPRHE